MLRSRRQPSLPGDAVARWKFWLRASRDAALLSPQQAVALGLQKSEARLWLSAALATSLTLVGFVTAYLPRTADPLFPAWHLRAEQIAPALLSLFLLFHIHLLHRRWELRRAWRKLQGDGQHPAEATDGAATGAEQLLDPETGLSTAAAAEEQLARELIATRKHGEPLSVLAVGLDQWKAAAQREGEASARRALQDFVRRLRRATRGSDFAIRMGADEFLAVLPGCPLKNVPRVVERLHVRAPDGRPDAEDSAPLHYSTAWVDPEPGESPREFLQRARKMLRLYQAAERNAAAGAVH